MRLLFLFSSLFIFLFTACDRDLDNQPDDGSIDLSADIDAPVVGCAKAISLWAYQSTHTALGSNITGLAFKDSNFGIAGGSNGNLYRTTDGGSNWTIVDNSITTAGLGNVVILENSVVYIGGGRGELTSTIAQQDVGEFIFTPAVFLSSKDGGTSWSKSYLEGFSGVGDLHFDDQQNGLAIMSEMPVNEDQPLNLYRTSDGGKSWSEVSLPVDYQVYAFTEIEGRLAMVGDGGILVRADASADWEERPFPTSGCGNIHFDGVSTGLMRCSSSSASVVYRTIDGGRSWKINDSPFYGESLVHLAPDGTGLIINKRRLLVGGDATQFIGNIFYETTDAGLSWTVVKTNGDCGYGRFLHPVGDKRVISIGQKTILLNR